MMEPDEYLPISMINQYAYCPRRFWLMYVQGEMAINAVVLEGTLQHERVHAAGREQVGEEVRYRRLYLWSDALGVSGFADLVEERGEVLIPIEHKHGRAGRWGNDALQVCAQGICLEERSGKPAPLGYVFYWGTRQRVEVPLTVELRAETAAAVAAMRALLAAGETPEPERPIGCCRECSLEPICMPREVRILRQRGEQAGVEEE